MADRYFANQPPLASRLWLVSTIFLVLLPHLTRLPLWLSLPSVLVVLWRLLRDYRDWPLPGKAIRVALTLMGIGAVFFAFRSIIGRDAGTALLTVLIALKMLELRTLRDGMVVIFLGYFLVAIGFLFDESIFTGLYMLVAVLGLSASLIILNHPSASLTGAPRYLKQAGALLLQSLPLMVLLFILFPRVTSPLWHMPEEKARARTGLSDEMRLGEITDLADSDELVFRAEFSASLPTTQNLYWRGPVLWNTDGQRWLRLTPAQLARLPRDPLDYESLATPVDYKIMLEPQVTQWLFALDLPAQLPEVKGGARLFADFQILSAQQLTERTRYAMRSTLSYRTGELNGAERRYALQLPQASNPLTRDLAEQWRAESTDDASLVAHTLDYFRTQPFFYTRRPPALGPDPVDEFLFTTRQGFCEHYASAFVTLMRAAQIPARVVTGYQGGVYNSVGNFLEVRQNRAHAWAEVWLADRGWVRIDPTAVIPQERITDQGDSSRFVSTEPLLGSSLDSPLLQTAMMKLRLSWGALNYAWSTWVIGFDAERQRALLKRWGLNKIDFASLLLLLVGLLFLLLSLLALFLLYRRTSNTDPVLRLYEILCRKLRRAGIEIHAHEGPQQLSIRAMAQLPHHAGMLREIFRLYVALRYGHGTAEDLAGLKHLVVRFKP